jgi:hypothetical protein
MMRDGTQIISGRGSRAALHALRQRAHRQKRQERLRTPTVPLPGLRGVPGAFSHKPDCAARAPSRNPARGGPGTPEPARRRARLCRGPRHTGALDGKKAEELPPLSETLLPAFERRRAGTGRALELVGSKANERWVWIALGRQTRQIVAFFVGDRSAESARALRMRIPPGYRCRASRNDFWLACEAAFPRHTRSLVRQGRRRDQPRRTLVLHVASALGPLRAQTPFLFQMRKNARSRSASVHPSLQPTTHHLTKDHHLLRN